MTDAAIYLLAKVVGGLVSLLVMWQWGKTYAQKEQAEKQLKERNADAAINTEPFVDSPFSRMRRKK